MAGKLGMNQGSKMELVIQTAELGLPTKVGYNKPSLIVLSVNENKIGLSTE